MGNEATYIEIRYQDGSVDRARGADAAHILAWYRSCEVIAHLHGSSYSGPKYEHSAPPKEPKCYHINMMGHESESWCMDCGERWPNNLHRPNTTVGFLITGESWKVTKKE